MKQMKKRRLELELSQYEIEKLTGIAQTKISLIERGYREPSSDERKKLAKALRLEVKELFEDKNNNPRFL